MQISSKSLTAKKQKKIFDHLHLLISDLRTPDQAEKVLKDFLTKTEYTVLAKRLAIAIMLDQGQSYESIRKELKVSSATISSVSDQMEEEGMKLAVKKIKVDQWAENAASKIQSWFGKK